MADESRFSISAEGYLDKHLVLTYIEDAVSQLLEHKETNPKVNTTKFFGDYFTSVKEGNHVLFRESAFIRATPHNRACFVRTFWKCFRNIGKKGDLLSVREYHSLLCLLCPDFPFAPVQKTARIILMEDAMDCLISFSDFLYAFQVQFCYDEFLSRCAEVYKELQTNPQASVDTVIVPTSEENSAPVHSKTTKSSSTSEGVDATQFFRMLIPICEKLETQSPSLPVLREILSAADRVTFYGFLMALAKSDSLNKYIGKLPVKTELLETSDPELTSPPLRPGSAAKLRTAISNPRPLSAANAPNVSSTSGAPNPASGSAPSSGTRVNAPARHSHTASRAPRRRRVAKSESSDDDGDSNDSDSTT